MGNPHPKCEICRLRHRPGNCRPEGGRRGPISAQGNRLHSIAIPVVDLTLVLAKLDAIGEKLDRMVNAKREIEPTAG